MKPLLVFASLVLSISFCLGEVEVPRSSSPNGEFILKMETDTDKQGYEMDEAPAMWIEDTRTKKRLAEFHFFADPNSDTSPMRNKVKCLWSPSGASVAIQCTERFYSHVKVFRLRGSLPESSKFVECPSLPEDEIIRRLIPRFKEFRSRWFQHPEGWIDDTVLIYTSGTSAIVETEEGGDPAFNAAYRFYVDFKVPESPVVKRIEHTEE